MELDRTDRHLLALLQRDTRLTYEELGDAVGLSAPAAYQRVRKLESGGAITGYHARLAPQEVGRGVIAFLRIQPGPRSNVERLVKAWDAAGEILECHRVTGETGYLLKLRVGEVGQVEPHLEAARKAGCTAEAQVGLTTLFERWTLPVVARTAGGPGD
jgi:Lrp/AsnC family leucine-responsive transcriptional regulator